MSLTLTELQSRMREHATRLSHTTEPITNETVHKEVLSGEGPPGSAPRDVYRHMIKLELWMNGGPNLPWPSKWADQTIGSLAERLLAEG